MPAAASMSQMQTPEQHQKEGKYQRGCEEERQTRHDSQFESASQQQDQKQQHSRECNELVPALNEHLPGFRAGVRRRSSARLQSRKSNEYFDPDLVHEEPVLLELQGYDPEHRACIYAAAEYNGSIYRIGDHVSLAHDGSTGDDAEWIVVCEGFYASRDNVPMFHGRWYWTYDDLLGHAGNRRMPRRSKYAAYERFSTGARDLNPVEAIASHVSVLSLRDFERIHRSHPDLCEGLYFCHRFYSLESASIVSLSSDAFPGDPVPQRVQSILQEAALGKSLKPDDASQSVLSNVRTLDDNFASARVLCSSRPRRAPIILRIRLAPDYVKQELNVKRRKRK